jgi:predicted transcriptional regulator of viral defense system
MKTLRSRSAHLLTELYERRRPTFTLADVQNITGLSAASARSLVRKARGRGLITRLKPGLYNLVPFELGRATEFVGDPYLIVREVVGGAPYFLSHGTAFELHRMVTQPQFSITVSCTRRIRTQTIGGYEYRFILVTPERVFGLMQHWVTKDQAVTVSDGERTIIDGLQRPALVGGITEVAKGLWMKRDTLGIVRLVDYAVRLNVGAVFRRLGYLLELYCLADEEQLRPLQDKLTATYQTLDPLVPADGHFLARWRLRLNITAEELNAVRLG